MVVADRKTALGWLAQAGDTTKPAVPIATRRASLYIISRCASFGGSGLTVEPHSLSNPQHEEYRRGIPLRA